MQADWEIEIGGDAPVIDACWPGFVDLRGDPGAAARLPEVKGLPLLAEMLARLNGASSPVWTAKCDVWRPERDAWDGDELDGSGTSAVEALACYIDLLPRSLEGRPEPDSAVQSCRKLCKRLEEIPIRCCRVDLIVRSARIERETFTYGTTAYLTACGATLDEAGLVLGNALKALTEIICTMAPATTGRTKLQ